MNITGLSNYSKETVASSTTTSYKVDYTYSSVYQIPLEVLYYDWYSMNAGGHIAVLENASDSLAEGGWLYVKFKSYDGSKISVHSYVWTATESIYKSWYVSEPHAKAVGLHLIG